MAEIVEMPKLTDTMEEGVLRRWAKRVGDAVAPGEVLAEIDTDKATMEFEALDRGVLLRTLVAEGQAVPPGTPIAIIGEPGEDVAELASQVGAPAAAAHDAGGDGADTAGPPAGAAEAGRPGPLTLEVEAAIAGLTEPRTQADWQAVRDEDLLPPAGSPADGGGAPPLARTAPGGAEPDTEPAEELDADLLETEPPAGEHAAVPAEGAEVSSTAHTLPAVPAVERRRRPGLAAPAAGAERGRVAASPLVRRLAREHGIDLQRVRGTGPGGRIVERDLDALLARAAPPSARAGAPAAAAGQASPAVVPAALAPTAVVPATAAATAAAGATAPAAPAAAAGARIALSPMRKTIARRMAESKSTAPHFYLERELDAGPLVRVRDQLRADQDVKVGVNDMVLRACALALRQVPELNASFDGDAVVRHARVDLGMAVAIDDGLVTPVIRAADGKSLVRIAAEARDLRERARARRLRPEEMRGSTFTVSNLGMHGIDRFAAVINPPEAGILAVGRMAARPVVAGDAIVVGRRIAVTLSCDHRTVDGAIGARFLAALADLVEHPMRLVL